MLVLGIETSCDETAVALYDGEKGLLAQSRLQPGRVAPPHGGVVPELASREHIERLLPMIEAALAEAGDRSRKPLTALPIRQVRG